MQRDYTVDSGAVALTAGTAKTLLSIATGSVVPVDIVEMAFSCDATSTGLLKVEFIVFTSDGTGTSYTPKAANGDASLVAAATTAKINYTVEPTGVTVVRTWDFALPTGPFDFEYPLGREFTIPVSKFYGYRFTTTTVSPNGFCTVTFEE
jgi:hypothetical protein